MELAMTRRHDLDWVRVCAFGLLVLYHVGMYYVSWDWHVKSPAAGPAIEPLMFLTAPWRLSLLFLVSGAATAFLFGKSSQRFLRMRSWRLLVPLVFGMLVVVVPQAYYEVVEKLPGGYTDGYLAFYARYLAGDGSFCRDGDCLDVPTWNHLWFVAYLWVYTVALWLLLRLPSGLVERTRQHLGVLLSGPGLLLWPALLLIVARVVLVARFESTHGLVDDWYNHAQYLPLFLLGFLIASADSIWRQLEKSRWMALSLAVVSYAFIAWYFATFDDANPAPDAIRILQRVAWGLNQWVSIVAILGFAHRLAPGDSPALRYLTQAVFPVYILHQTVIVVAAYNLKPLGIAPLPEGLLLTALTFAACFGGYEIIRRVGWLRPLFGLKRRAPALELGNAVQPAS
jgi:glucan biosynthesis protein C